MRLSRTYAPTLRETPSDAEIASHRFMLRGGYVRQQAAGIYAWLPMGYRVLKKIEAIVREEQDRAGAAEMLMPTIQPASLWRESGRYDAYGPEMLRIEDRSGRDMLYGPTNEEMLTEIVRAGVRSYKQLPLMLYHQQWKFRDELRPRFGVMRGREFLMKDAYSFDLTAEAARQSYYKMFVAYLRTFDRLGVEAVPVRADPGPIGGDLSHEFVLLAENGESEVYLHGGLKGMPVPPVGTDYDGDLEAIFLERTSLYARTDEMHDEALWAKVPDADKLTLKGIEVGHVFYFGTKYSGPMGARVQGPDGRETDLEMGSYGIGVSRLVGAIIEAHHDGAGPVWPVPVAPYHVGVVNLKAGQADTDEACERLVRDLEGRGVEVLYDDTGDRAGEKFARMDLFGLPYAVTVGPRGLKDGIAEVKTRATGEKRDVPLGDVAGLLAGAVADALDVR